MLIIHIDECIDRRRERLIAGLLLRQVLDLLSLAHPDQLLVVWLHLKSLLLSLNDSFIFSVVRLHVETHHILHLDKLL
jgi:hypothetical protein